MPPAHPSSCPYGRNPRRRRARLAASDRHQWTDAEPLSCVAQPGKRIIAVEPPGARRARVVRCIRPIARAASTASGRSQWTDAKPFREPRSRKSEGYARWCFASPAHPSSCPCGRNPRRGARLAASGRHQWTDAEPYRASRSRGRGSSQWNSPERAGRGWYVRWYAASVQLPGRRVRFALQAVIGGRTRSLIVRRAAGKENRRSGTARSAPGASGTLHPSNCPGGEHGLRFRPSLVDGRGALSCVAQSGKRIAAVESPGARRARVVREVVRCIRPIARAASTASGRSQWTDAKPFREPRSRKSEGYARWCFTSPAHPSSRPCGRNPRRRRARPAASGRLRWTDAEPLSCVARPGKRIVAVEPPGTRRARVVRCIRPIAWAASTVCASGRHWWTDAEPYRASRSRERESSQWNRPERAGREWYAASVQLPGRRARFALQAVLNGRTRRLSVSRAAGKVRDTRDGVLRLRHIRPVARTGGIRGGEHGLRLQAVIDGRTRSLYRASRGRESGTAFYTSGTSVQSPVRAESAAAASTACSFRPSSMDGRGAFPCATQSRKE